MTTQTEQQKGTVINLAFFIPDVELDYILSGCFEGGSNYWITKKITCKDDDFFGAEFASEALSKGATLLIAENDGKLKVHELSKEKLLVGLKTYMEKENNVDLDSMDAGQYDLILQYALFNEIKYS